MKIRERNTSYRRRRPPRQEGLFLVVSSLVPELVMDIPKTFVSLNHTSYSSPNGRFSNVMACCPIASIWFPADISTSKVI
jgi:hypothetical protein